eukprot:c13670_g1_i1 orf=1-453(-)
MGQISGQTWDTYLQQLYHKGCQKREQQRGKKQSIFWFTKANVLQGITKLARGKASDNMGWLAECLKWAGESIIDCIVCMFNAAQKEGFPLDWQENLIVPIYKAGNPDIPNNYRTIMISSLMAKLYSVIIEKEISQWAEKHGVRAISQAGFR